MKIEIKKGKPPGQHTANSGLFYAGGIFAG